MGSKSVISPIVMSKRLNGPTEKGEGTISSQPFFALAILSLSPEGMKMKWAQWKSQNTHFKLFAAVGWMDEGRDDQCSVPSCKSCKYNRNRITSLWQSVQFLHSTTAKAIDMCNSLSLIHKSWKGFQDSTQDSGNQKHDEFPDDRIFRFHPLLWKQCRKGVSSKKMIGGGRQREIGRSPSPYFHPRSSSNLSR